MATGLTGYLVLAGVTLAAIALFLAAMVARRGLAPRAPSRTKLSTYESGVDPVGTGWAQSQIRYASYVFLYLVFAVDAVYLFPWALVLHDRQLNAASLVEMGIFIAVILVGLGFAIRHRHLGWDLSSRDGGAPR